jgi:WD40 repeat protein/serine/threonine protein kinase
MAQRADSSHDLLFGLIALEQGHIDQAQLLSAFRTWNQAGSPALPDILIAHHALNDAGRSLVERLTTEALDRRAAEPSATITHVGRAPAEGPSPSVSRSAGGRFLPLRPHARGGLGAVFVALDPELNRQVALKELLAHRAHDPASQARFLLEAELTGRLEHPGIVPIYGLGRYADGRPYYAMRFIEGETLRSAIDRFHDPSQAAPAPGGTELAFRRLLGSLVDACNAVAYAHSRGVVHRDLKPDNIMLGRFGETLVVDWGIAKLVDELGAGAPDSPALQSREKEASLTLPGSVVGTPRYMSPEQAAGELHRVGPASDIYGLGATLYCLLVGNSPFPSDDAKRVLNHVRSGVFPAPRRVRRDVDPALEAICLRAMSLQPEDRHASALVLAQELETWLADVRYRGEHERALNQMRGSLARLSLERAYGFLEREKHAEGMLWLARALEHAPSELEQTVRAALSGWHGAAKMLERNLRHRGAVHALAFCPEGRRLATASHDGSARLWDVATGAPLGVPLGHDGPVRTIAFHPTGNTVVTAGDDGQLKEWDAVTGELKDLPLAVGASVLEVCFSADGSTLATRCEAGEAVLWNAATRQPIRSSPGSSAGLHAIAFAPDGLTIAVSLEAGDVVLWDVATARRFGTLFRHEAAVPALAFSPDGRTLLTGCRDGKARLWEVDRTLAEATFDHRAAITQLDFSPGGGVIATAGEDGTARLWDTATVRPIGEPLAHRERVDCLAFSPDGTILATGSRDGTARLWDTQTGLAIAPPLVHHGAVAALAFNLDGRRLATGSADGFARCWQIASPLQGTAERVMCWTRITAELEFDEGDALRRMDGPTSWALRRLLVELGGPPVRS